MFLFWFGQGVSWGGHSMFCVLCFLFLCGWPGMVLNQGQLSIVVSDWEPYLGSLFPTCVCGRLTLVRAFCLWASRFVFVVLIVLFGIIWINKGNVRSHAAPWSAPSNSRDKPPRSNHPHFVFSLSDYPSYVTIPNWVSWIYVQNNTKCSEARYVGMHAWVGRYPHFPTIKVSVPSQGIRYYRKCTQGGKFQCIIFTHKNI